MDRKDRKKKIDKIGIKIILSNKQKLAHMETIVLTLDVMAKTLGIRKEKIKEILNKEEPTKTITGMAIKNCRQAKNWFFSSIENSRDKYKEAAVHVMATFIGKPVEL